MKQNFDGENAVSEFDEMVELGGTFPVENGNSDDYCYFNTASCPDCENGMVRLGGCFSCPTCGFESCSM